MTQEPDGSPLIESGTTSMTSNNNQPGSALIFRRSMIVPERKLYPRRILAQEQLLASSLLAGSDGKSKSKPYH